MIFTNVFFFRMWTKLYLAASSQNLLKSQTPSQVLSTYLMSLENRETETEKTVREVFLKKISLKLWNGVDTKKMFLASASLVDCVVLNYLLISLRLILTWQKSRSLLIK